MNIGRIFANAIVRRIAYVVVAAALAWLGLGRAHAQTYDYSRCASFDQSATCRTVAEANAALQAMRSNTCAASGVTRCDPANIVTTKHNDLHYSLSMSFYYIRNGAGYDTSGNRTVRVSCSAGQVHNGISGQCQPACASRPVQFRTFSSIIPAGSITCDAGCEARVNPVGDGTYSVITRASVGVAESASHCYVVPNNCSNYGTGFGLNAYTGMCQPAFEECAENEVKDPATGVCEQGCPAGMILDAIGVCKPREDDCPAGNVRAPSGQCLPGDGQCAAGEARRDNGTCGRDSDGDGEADEDDDDPENDPERESFSGGDTCSAPPSCSGGAVECGMARIQWRIDCNTRRTVNVTGGSCTAMPVCVGENCKAMEYAQLLQQWRAACALEKLAGNEPGEGGDNQDLIDLLTDPGSIQPDLGGTGDMPGGGGYTWGDEGEDFEPDTSGMGWGSACPSPPAISVFGQTISFNLTPLCNWLALAGNLVIILASLASLRIVSGGTA